jgi:hypothetical protein
MTSGDAYPTKGKRIRLPAVHGTNQPSRVLTLRERCLRRGVTLILIIQPLHHKMNSRKDTCPAHAKLPFLSPLQGQASIGVLKRLLAWSANTFGSEEDENWYS